MSCLLKECVEFIDKNRVDSKVLVHCQFGISRSASIVISYIMWKYKLSYEFAFDFVSKKREKIQPNEGFEKQLMIFEMLLRENDYKLTTMN